MTTLKNGSRRPPPERVSAALARLDALARYDPGVARGELQSSLADGLGASRRCDLRDGGWFRERVTVSKPCRELEFERHDCTQLVRRLRTTIRSPPTVPGRASRTAGVPAQVRAARNVARRPGRAAQVGRGKSLTKLSLRVPVGDRFKPPRMRRRCGTKVRPKSRLFWTDTLPWSGLGALASTGVIVYARKPFRTTCRRSS
jgi:hypothetical protein